MLHSLNLIAIRKYRWAIDLGTYGVAPLGAGENANAVSLSKQPRLA